LNRKTSELALGISYKPRSFSSFFLYKTLEFLFYPSPTISREGGDCRAGINFNRRLKINRGKKKDWETSFLHPSVPCIVPFTVSD